MRKHFILSLTLAIYLSSAWAIAPKEDANEFLKTTAKVLRNLKIVRYDYAREISNKKNNYFSRSSAQCFIDFEKSENQTFARFQLINDAGSQIYNGSEYFSLSTKEKTIEIIEKPNDSTFRNFSYFYNSIPTLNNLLEQIIIDTSILKSVKDTLITSTSYKVIHLQLPNKSMGLLGFSPFSIELTVYYAILIDLKSGLPFQIIEHNSIDKDQYQVKTTFSNIEKDPKTPNELSWYYSTYNEYRLKTKGVQIPLVQNGDEVKFWSLPVFHPTENRTVNKDDFKGKIVMLDFWIKNCSPCMESFPHLKALQEKYGDKNFQLLTVNAYDDKKEIGFFYKREKPKYLMLYNGKYFGKQLGVNVYPSIIILGKDGKVIYSATGFDKKAVEEIIKENI